MKPTPVFVAYLLLTGCAAGSVTAPPARTMTEFATNLEQLRTDNNIPGISVVIAKDQSIVWTRGFGLASIGGEQPVTPATVFHLASLTKPFAATVIMQLVEQGLVSLDDPVSKYGIVLTSPTPILVRHLMSHTSEGTPGTAFRYNGNRFSLLDSVIARTTHASFAQQLQERILKPLQLAHTAPNVLSAADFATSGMDRSVFSSNLAQGYTRSGSTLTPTAYPNSFSTAAGLIASASDVALFSMALDRGMFLAPATRELMYTPARTPSGATLPYALGWFVTQRNGVRLLWHYGLWTGISALIIKVPERGLTYVVLANSPGLNDQYDIIGDLENSPWARAFLDAFVFGSTPLTSDGSS